jgi:hypothetical protein
VGNFAKHGTTAFDVEEEAKCTDRGVEKREMAVQRSSSHFSQNSKVMSAAHYSVE